MAAAATSSRPAAAAALLALLVAAAAVVSLAAAGRGDVDEQPQLMMEGAGRYPPLAPGLSFDFYKKSCPEAESIVRDFLSSAVRQNVGLAAALIRLHFHDCFVQGCDASILLDSTPTQPSEQESAPNRSLRPAAFKAVNDIRARLEQACGRVVSCADIVALAARESVALGGGPSYMVPLGRRDGLAPASDADVLGALPPPTSTVPTLLSFLAKIKLDATDLVALSGGHTVGLAHCGSFRNRLFPTQDPTLNKFFAGQLYGTCPTSASNNTRPNDVRTPNAFDNKYYVDLLNREGLFTSDQDLLTNATTRPLVTRFAVDQAAFFDQFVYSYVKMGQIGVLTGAQGQVRANCSARNSNGGEDLPAPAWSSVVETVVDAAGSLVL